jgi:hypothetical protein
MQMMRMNLKKFSSHEKQISHMPRKMRITVQGSHDPKGVLPVSIGVWLISQAMVLIKRNGKPLIL